MFLSLHIPSMYDDTDHIPSLLHSDHHDLSIQNILLKPIINIYYILYILYISLEMIKTTTKILGN